MKSRITLFLAMVIITMSTAQQGINYKALIKDNTGNVIANDLIIVQFSILQGAAETNVYTETHTPTTDPNGLIILNIGEGTQVIGDFITIDWASDTHALNIQINTGAGLVDLGTTSFQKVPYAKHAATATVAETSDDTKWAEGTTTNDITNNNSGNVEINGALQIQATAPIEEFSIDGTLVDNSDTTVPTEQAVKTYVDGNLATGLEALDEGNGIGWRLKGRDPTFYGTIGDNAIDLSFSGGTSINFGATGIYSTAMGLYTEASGDYSTAMGITTTASGNFSSAMGRNTIASGNSSTSMGSYSNATADYSTAIGEEVLASGTNSIAVGWLTIASGNISTAMGETTDATGSVSTAMGSATTASGSVSTAMGSATTASGVNSTAMGNISEASGSSSTAMGWSSNASGSSSTAMGSATTASGNVSTAMGSFSTASGNFSTVMGSHTTAPSYSETVTGSYNTDYSPNSTFSWSATDRLFVVGNGENTSNKSNALTIFKNGNVALGNITPSANTIENVLDVGGRMRLRPKTGSGSTSGIWYSDVGGSYTQFAGAKTHSLIAANREWGIYISGYKFWVNGSGNATLTGSLSQNSDRRLKKDISHLTYGLNEILQLEPKQYFWKDRENQKQASLGLIAQDVQEVIANIVHESNDDKKTLSLSYIELIPVLINAIKEQQAIIGNQQSTISVQNTNYLNILKRLNALENNKLQDGTYDKAATFETKRE